MKVRTLIINLENVFTYKIIDMVLTKKYDYLHLNAIDYLQSTHY